MKSGLLFVLSFILVAKARPLTSLVECISCHATIDALREYAKEPSHYTNILDIARSICIEEVGLLPAICDGYMSEYEDVFIGILANKYLDSDRLCVDLGYCTTPTYVEENFTNYVVNTMKGKPPGPGPVPTGRKSFTFAHVSDIHLDVYYTTGANENCDEPLCCRTGTGNTGYWGTVGNCDMPLRTLEAGLQQISALKPDFVIITGDFPPHDMWNQSRDYNLQYQVLVSDSVKKYLGDIPVYPMYGNHACYPINQYQFGVDQWIPAPFCKDWDLPLVYKADLELHAGYSVRHRLTNLRLIALDTQAGNAGNYYLTLNATDPQGLLTWLYQQLALAENNKEMVYLYAHIPFGDVDCLSEWSRHANVLLDRFEYTIAGVFFGHTHDDELHISRGAFTNSITKVQWIAPSFTTNVFRNPAFRIFEADEDTKIITDYTQYRLDLAKANASPNVTAVWDIAYSFKQLYGVKDLSAQSIYGLALNIGNNETLALQYLSNFHNGLPAPTSCDRDCLHMLQCRLTYGVSDDIFNCQGVEKGWLFKFNEQLFGNWTYKNK